MFSFFNKTREVSETQFREVYENHQGCWVTHDTGTFTTNRQYLIAVDADGNELSNTVVRKWVDTAKYASGGMDVTETVTKVHSLPVNWEEVYAVQRISYSGLPTFRKLVARNNHDKTVQVFSI